MYFVDPPVFPDELPPPPPPPWVYEGMDPMYPPYWL
jgi:hypothetical protein